MENNAANRVKSYLEKLYDIPFDVEEKNTIRILGLILNHII